MTFSFDVESLDSISCLTGMHIHTFDMDIV